MLRSAPERVLTACCALACCFTLFSFRLVHIQVTKHDEYAALAAKTHGTKQTLYARRGTISDVRGTPLAQNEPVKRVVADASIMKDLQLAATVIAKRLDMNEASVLKT